MKTNRKTMQYLPNNYCNNYGVKDFEITKKLGPLEDWEDLYGIELLTLLKTEEVYWRIKFTDCSGYSEIQKSYKCYIDLHNHQLIVYSNEYDEFGYPLPFEDYGNTWALTREELEPTKEDMIEILNKARDIIRKRYK